MTKKIASLLLVAASLTAGACTPTPLYSWGNYSTTLYHLRKDATDETRDKHMAELEAIVTRSKENNLRIPPGVYCELGYMHAQKGNNKQALELLALEKSTYPESTLLVDRLVERIKIAPDAKKESAAIETKKTGS